MSDFDQAARYAVKQDPMALLGWLLPGLPERLRFVRWANTQSFPLPGEPDRRSDTVAELEPLDRLGPPWLLLVELQTRPDPDMLERILEYLARLRRELRHGPHYRDRFQVGACLLQLTGRPSATSLDMVLPGQTAVRLALDVRCVAWAEEKAGDLMDAIAGRRASTLLLPWVPLTGGGQEAEAVARWKEVVQLDPDLMHRRVLGGVANTFAELTDCATVWNRGLEDLMVERSKLWDKIRAEERTEGRVEGRVEGVRESLQSVLRARFRDEFTPTDLQRLEAQTSQEELVRLLAQAATAATMEQFRQAAAWN